MDTLKDKKESTPVTLDAKTQALLKELEELLDDKEVYPW